MLSDIQGEGYTSVPGGIGLTGSERAADCAYYIKNGVGAGNAPHQQRALRPMKRLLAVVLTGLVMTSGATVAKDKALPTLPKGTQVGVVNILDPEVMHYHAARQTINSYVKIQAVNWNVDEMLLTALQAQPAVSSLTLTPVAPSDALVRARESCFVNASLAKGLAKNCSAPLIELANSANVSYLIVMAPGLNNADHSNGGPRLETSSMLRGWGFVTHEFAGSKDKPNLFCEVEMLLIAVTPDGATLRARQWGGSYNYQWQAYAVPPDPKAVPPEQLDQLQPLFATILGRQAKDFLEQVHVEQ
jgi:hypothetical protein